MVFALPAASAPPISVTAISPSDGSPRLASSIVGSVVTSSSSMILGLVSATSDRAISPGERRPTCDEVTCDEARPLAAACTAAASGSAFVACVTRRPRSPALHPQAPCPQAPFPRAQPLPPQRPHAGYYRA